VYPDGVVDNNQGKYGILENHGDYFYCEVNKFVDARVFNLIRTQMASEESRNSILKAAINAFSTKGFDGASIRDIAQEAKVNHAIIRYHFGSKDDLWMAVFQHLLLETANLRKSSPFNKAATDLKSELEKFVRTRVEHVVHQPQLLKIILLELIDGGPRFAQIDMLMRMFFAETLNIVQDMQQAGVVKDFNNKDLFFVIPTIIGIRGIYPNLDKDFDGNTVGLEEVIRAHTDVIMKMIYKG